jgi:hypothetical protein
VVEVSAERPLRTREAQLLSLIGRQEWLDRPSYRLEHLLGIAFNSLGKSRDRVANALNGVWLGHPAHPPMASLASGAVGTTVGLDALSLLPGRSKSERTDASRFATRALGLGIAANLGSAVTGAADWQHTHQEDRRVGLVHGVLNTVATGFYVLSWVNRRRGRHGRGVIASTLGYGITVSAGYLGGALVSVSISPVSGCAPRNGLRYCGSTRLTRASRSASKSTDLVWWCAELATTAMLPPSGSFARTWPPR